MQYTYIGFDVSSDKADIVWLNEPLSISPRDYYESADFNLHHAELPKIAHALDFIKSLNPTVIILEPTGVYSRFWIDGFKRLQIPFLLCNQTMIADARKALGGSSNKNDPFDCLVLLEVYFKYHLERYDRRFWLKERGETVREISRLLQEIDSITKRRTQTINAAKQRLSYEFPAKAKVSSVRNNGKLDPDILPAWWAWCCGWTETPTWKLRSREKTMFDREYAEAMHRHEGSGISNITREMARSICHWHICEAMLEQEYLPLLDAVEFKPYHEVFDELGFSQRERGWILTRIYPFENFLGVPKFRSRRRFRQALGQGKITSQSGKSFSTSQKSTGAARIHSVLFCWVTWAIGKGVASQLKAPGVPQLTKWDCCPQTDTCSKIRDYYITRAYYPESLRKKSGKLLVGAKSATARHTAEILFNRLYDRWCSQF